MGVGLGTGEKMGAGAETAVSQVSSQECGEFEYETVGVRPGEGASEGVEEQKLEKEGKRQVGLEYGFASGGWKKIREVVNRVMLFDMLRNPMI